MTVHGNISINEKERLALKAGLVLSMARLKKELKEIDGDNTPVHTPIHTLDRKVQDRYWSLREEKIMTLVMLETLEDMGEIK